MSDYWTPAWPNGAPNGPNPGGMSNHTLQGGYPSAYFRYSCYNWCDCELLRGPLDTTPIECGAYEVQSFPVMWGGYSENAITIPNGVWERNFIWDSCLNMCVTTSGCAITQDSSFSGGCSEIPGTGS